MFDRYENLMEVLSRDSMGMSDVESIKPSTKGGKRGGCGV
jgi:hypothetical protein